MIEIKKPRIECIETPADESYGKYIIEPLERGYGTTLGNSLRRVLLSSLPGTACTSIAGMLCEGRFALYLAGEPYKSGLKAQGCGKLKKAVFTMELDPDEEDETEAE